VKRRALVALPLSPLLPFVAAAPRAVASEVFPSRPVTLVVPWPAGGATDLTMRLLAELAARPLGQPVQVENRGGAAGTLAMPLLQQAAPDGYTIAQLPHTALRAPHLQRVLWDPIRDTTPILQVSGTTFGIVVPAASPWQSLAELLAYAESHPGQLNLATNGVGTTPHLVMEELLARRGARWVHLPYRGVAEQMVAVASGQVMAAAGASGYVPFVESGKLRLLATFGAERGRRFPNVPTLAELGHGIVAMSPWGLVGPRGLPPAVVRVLHDAFKAAMHEPAYVAELARYDQAIAYLGPEDYGRVLREAFAAERRHVERLGLKTP
jgi:tripartite-type tricarboxylate transporter receptor subunit TctC